MHPEEWLSEATEMKEELTAARRYLHARAETGFALEKTLSYVRSSLEGMGYTPVPCGRAGLTATVGGNEPGKVFLLRADMDALPIREQTDEDFASRNGNMHACGHDMHTTMLLGAAKLLKAHENELRGRVRLMFQPAEELFAGAADMIAAGVLRDPAPDAALMIHVITGVPFAPGTVIVSTPGVAAPAADHFTIRVMGRGSHGSMSEKGRDPLSAAAHILIALQEIHARELSLSDRAVLTVGTLHAGTAANAIPDEAVMEGSLRTCDERVRSRIRERMTDIAVCVSKAFRTEAEVIFGAACPTLRIDRAVCEASLGYLRELLGRDGAFSAAELRAEGDDGLSGSAGSEDFAYVSQRVPSVMLALAAGQPEKGYTYSLHHPMVRFDCDALPAGCAAYAYTAMRWLEDHAGGR